MNYKISIIIPVYGVEDYIEKCISSVLSQTLEEIQIIVVDDCSKDKSIDILKNLIKGHKREKDFIIIRKEKNEGLAYARKTGIEYINSEYVLHLDSDDYYYSNDTLEKIYITAKKENADIVVCDYIIKYPNGKEKLRNKNIPKIISSEKIIEYRLYNKIAPSLWSHLIKSELYKQFDIEFLKEVPSFGEDIIHIVQLYSFAKKIVYLNIPIIYYIQRSSSFSFNNYKYIMELPIINEFVENFLHKKYLYDEDRMDMIKILNKHYLLKRWVFTDSYKIFLNINKDSDKKIWENPYFSFFEKIRFFLYIKSPIIAYIYSKILDILAGILFLLKKINLLIFNKFYIAF